jgi:hypothetical protein
VSPAPPVDVEVAQPATEDVQRLLDAALELYRDDPAARARLGEAHDRVAGPLRVALVGRVKAGKSTLLNALVGARIAPTDAGECTRVVTVYRHGTVPRVVLEEASGGRRNLPVRRVDGGLQLDLAGTATEEVDHLTVDWPAPALAAATLVDTPGISSLSAGTSARTHSFLDTGDRLPGADAVVFLTRQLQADDVAFLSAFQARTAGTGRNTTTITVLSRADEVGSGRLDALRAATDVARRMAADPAVQRVTSTVLPVAGLLALAGRTLRHADFVALRSLAHGPREDVDRMLLTADRFCRREAPVPVTQTVRATLLERLGLFGVRLSVTLVRAGLGDAQSLADELVRRSGLAELQRQVAVHFTRRAAQLTAGTALRTVEAVLRERPLPGTGPLWQDLERLQLSGHGLVELAVLARAHGPGDGLPETLRTEGERLLGADGPGVATRLGLPDVTPVEQLRAAADAALTRWRSQAGDALAGRGTREAVDAVVQSCEAMLAALDGLPGSGPAAAQPGAGRPEEEGDQGEDDQPELDQETDPVQVHAAGHDALRDVARGQRQQAGSQ